VPTRLGINLISAQYAKLKNACEELLMHTDSDQPLEKELGFNLSARNKLCMVNGKTVRKVVFFNDRTSGSFDIGLNELEKWCDNYDQIEEAIAN